MKITIYTDGSAKGNPGNGGFGTVMIAGKHYKEVSEGLDWPQIIVWNYWLL